MESVNIGEIRARLKHGDLAIIAKKCNLHVRQVSEVLNKGRDAAGNYDSVVACALDLLKGEAEQKASIVAKAKEAGFSTTSFSRNAYRNKRKSAKGKNKPGGVWKVVKSPFVIIGAVVVAFLMFGGAKLFSKKQ